MSLNFALIIYAVFVLALLATFALSLIFRRNKGLNPIRLYLFLYIFFIAIEMLANKLFQSKQNHSILYNIFSMIDLSILYYYFYKQNDNIVKAKWILGLYFLILSIILIYWFGPSKGIVNFRGIEYGIQNLFIIVPCLFYFNELFKSENLNDLKTNPHFYIACSVFFFYAVTFPFFMAYKTLFDITPYILSILNMVETVVIIIQFILISKAFLCPPQDQK